MRELTPSWHMRHFRLQRLPVSISMFTGRYGNRNSEATAWAISASSDARPSFNQPCSHAELSRVRMLTPPASSSW